VYSNELRQLKISVQIPKEDGSKSITGYYKVNQIDDYSNNISLTTREIEGRY